MLGLLNTVLSRGGSLLTYVKDGLVMANRFLTPPKLTFPVSGSAAFNGTSDYIDTGAQPLTDFTNFTYSFWVYFDDVAIYQNMVGFGSTLNLNPVSLLETGASGKIKFFHRNLVGTSIALETQIVNSKNWYFVTATKEGTSFKIYLDGSLEASGAQTITDSVYNTFNIGRLLRTSAQGYFNGNLANVAIWNRALSSDEINSVMWKTYEQVSTTESNGLQAWYKLSADEVISGTSTATLTAYANANSLTFEAPACVQTALNGLPDITDARLYSANYDIRVKADGGNVESLNCVETELNAIL